jgi:hypothetical protein
LGSNFFFSQIKKFKAYVHSFGCRALTDLLENPGKDTPLLLASWIQSSCDRDPDGVHAQESRQPGRPRTKKNGQNNTWQHAQKMRASASHYYSIDKKRGNGTFQERADGSWSGNPSLSDFMREYMKSLKRRKVSTYCTLFLIKCFKGSYLFLDVSDFLDAGRGAFGKRESDNFAENPGVI